MHGHQIVGLFRKTSTTANIPDASELSSFQGHVKFRNVKPLLEGLSFDCRCGEIIAFVGKSGVGKSTIFKLMLREYLVQDGYIQIDEQDIRKVTKQSLRRHWHRRADSGTL